MDIQVWRPQLEDILAHDTDRALAASTIPAVQALWPIVQRAGDASDICKAALIYSLYETTVEGEDGLPHAKWELTQLARYLGYDPEADDPEEEFLPCSATWQEFCLVHLQMARPTAVKYKRIWAVFNKKLGYGLEDLLGAGVFKLGATVSTLDKMLRAEGGVDPRLIVALFGNEHVCSACDSYVPFEVAPEVCPHCGVDYQGRLPMSGPKTILLLDQIKHEMQGGEKEPAKLDMFASLEHSFDDDGVVSAVSLLAECGLGGTERSSLPSWELNIIDDSAPPGVLGLRQSHLQALEDWLRRKFPGA